MNAIQRLYKSPPDVITLVESGKTKWTDSDFTGSKALVIGNNFGGNGPFTKYKSSIEALGGSWNGFTT